MGSKPLFFPSSGTILERNGQRFAPFAPWREMSGRFHAPQFKGHARRALYSKGQNFPRLGTVGGEKIWHESQKITKLPDGGLEVTFRVAGLDEIKRWILSLGPEAQVLEPSRLKQMIRADLQKSLGHYSAHRTRYEISETQEIRRMS